MPARTSSPVPAPLEPLAHAVVLLSPREIVDLRRFLDRVPDPRGLRGRRYPAVALLTAAAAAVLAGAWSLAAVGEWIADAPQQVRASLGLLPDPLTAWNQTPHAGTVRRLLHRVDADALDAAIGAYLQARQTARHPRVPGRRVIAVDGKTVRGSRTAPTTAVQLLAAMDHHGVVLAQRQISSKSNEIPAFAPLLDGLDLTDAVMTTDALYTQHGHGRYLIGRGAHYLAIVKKNHPGLYAQVKSCHGGTSRWSTAPATTPTIARRSAG